MSSVKLDQATKPSLYPSTTDSFPVCLSITALRISAWTHAHITNKADKTALKCRRVTVVFCLDAMLTWTGHMTRRVVRLVIYSERPFQNKSPTIVSYAQICTHTRTQRNIFLWMTNCFHNLIIHLGNPLFCFIIVWSQLTNVSDQLTWWHHQVSCCCRNEHSVLPRTQVCYSLAF